MEQSQILVSVHVVLVQEVYVTRAIGSHASRHWDEFTSVDAQMEIMLNYLDVDLKGSAKLRQLTELDIVYI